jgi:hypothetical protein
VVSNAPSPFLTLAVSNPSDLPPLLPHIRLVPRPSAVPEPPLSRRGSHTSVVHTIVVLNNIPLPAPRTTATEENQQTREEQTHHGRQQSPHGHPVTSRRARPIAVHGVLDHPRPHEIERHDDHTHDEGEGREEGGEQGAQEAGAEGEKEGEEGEEAEDRVQDHDARERVGCVPAGRGLRVGRTIDLGHDVCGVVAD